MAGARGEGDYSLSVKPEEVFQAAHRLKAIADELTSNHERITARVRDVVGAAWRGQASQAFTEDWDEFDRAARSICEDAAAIASLVEYAGQTYLEMDADNAAAARAVYPKGL